MMDSLSCSVKVGAKRISASLGSLLYTSLRVANALAVVSREEVLTAAVYYGSNRMSAKSGLTIASRAN